MSASPNSAPSSTGVQSGAHTAAHARAAASPAHAPILQVDPPSSSSSFAPRSSFVAASSSADSAKSFSTSTPRASLQHQSQAQASSIGRDNSEKHSSAMSSHRTATSPTAMLERATLRDASEQREVHSAAAAAGSSSSTSAGAGDAASSSFRFAFDHFASSSPPVGNMLSASASLFAPPSSSPSSLAVRQPLASPLTRGAHAVGTFAESDDGMDDGRSDDVRASLRSAPATAPAVPIAPAASTQRASASVPAAQQHQQQRIVTRQVGAAAAESKDEVDARLQQASSSSSSSASSSTAFVSRLQQMLNRPRAAASASASVLRASASSSSSSTARAPAFSSACHCLVVDSQRIAAASSDVAKLAAAIAAADGNRRAHTLALLPLVDPTTVAAAYTVDGSTRQLHINFRSFVALGAALNTYPFLVRCGQQQAQASWSPKPCGPVRSALPELLELTCEPSRAITADECSAEVTAMLAAMGIEHTSISTVGPSPHYRGNQPTRITVTIVPRHILDMREDLVRLHRAHTLFGSDVLVSAPNRADLARCGHCNEIGHPASACPAFGGVAVRLLMSEPMPYASLLDLVSASGARGGYLGSTTGEGPPRRVVTLLLDNDESNSTANDSTMERLADVIEELRDRLHTAPYIVNTADRDSECRECGSSQRGHRCEFETGPTALRRTIVQQHEQQQQHPQQQSQQHQHQQQQYQYQQQQQQQRQYQYQPPARLPQPSAFRPSGGDAAARRATQVCSEWHSSKTCRLLSGNGSRCGYAHPADYVTSQTPICYDYRDRGSCALGDRCRYLHGQAPPAQEGPRVQGAGPDAVAPSVVHTPVVAPVTASASASASAAPAASASIVAPISILPRPASQNLDDMRNQRVAAMEAASAPSSSSSAPPPPVVAARTRSSLSQRGQGHAQRQPMQPVKDRQKRTQRSPSGSPAPAPASPARASPRGGGKRNKKAGSEDESAVAAVDPIILSNRYSGLDALVDDVEAAASSSSSSSSASSAVPISSLGSISSPNRVQHASAGRPRQAASNSARRSINVDQSSGSAAAAAAVLRRPAAVAVHPAAAVPASSASSSLSSRPPQASPPGAGSDDDGDPDAVPPSPSPAQSARSSAHDAEMGGL